MTDPITPFRPAPPPKAPPPDARAALLHARAVALEAAFLAEMLGHAGLGATSGAFSGGAGEEQFASFLRNAQADAIARRGGIGLAEHIYTALMARADAAP